MGIYLRERDLGKYGIRWNLGLVCVATDISSPFRCRQSIVIGGCTFRRNRVNRLIVVTFLVVTLLVVTLVVVTPVPLIIEKELQHPPEFVERGCPSLEFIGPLIGCANTPPPQCQNKQEKTILASFLYFAPIRQHCVVRWILGKGNCNAAVIGKDTPFGLKAGVPRLPAIAEAANEVGDIGHIVKETVPLEPIVDSVRAVLATKCVFLSLSL